MAVFVTFDSKKKPSTEMKTDKTRIIPISRGSSAAPPFVTYGRMYLIEKYTRIVKGIMDAVKYDIFTLRRIVEKNSFPTVLCIRTILSILCGCVNTFFERL